MTGCPPPVAGAYTFRYKQSSLVDGEPNGDAPCAQCGASSVASRSAVNAAGATGGFQRSAPTGGAAYGMPRKLRMVAVALPRTGPAVVITRGPAGAASAARGAAGASAAARFFSSPPAGPRTSAAGGARGTKRPAPSQDGGPPQGKGG